MTPRDRWRRCTAYARASYRWAVAFRRRDASDPDGAAVLRELDRRQGHAWARLPDNARAAMLPPEGV